MCMFHYNYHNLISDMDKDLHCLMVHYMICFLTKNQNNYDADVIGCTLAISFPVGILIIWIFRPGWLVWIVLWENTFYFTRFTFVEIPLISNLGMVGSKCMGAMWLCDNEIQFYSHYSPHLFEIDWFYTYLMCVC